MVNRKIIAALSIAASAAAPPSLLGAFHRAPHGADVANVQAPVVNRIGDGAVIQWVIRASDIAACESAAPAMRTILYQYRGQVHIDAVYVGEDTTLVRSFLHAERLGRVNVRTISEREFARDFAHRFSPARTPLAVLVVQGVPDKAFFADVRAAAGRRDVEALTSTLAALLSPHDAPTGSQGLRRFMKGDDAE